MILHFVGLNLRADHDAAELSGVMAGLAALVSVIDGFEGFEHGPNLDFEGKSADYPYGFLCRFTNAQALSAYADDPRHKALGGQLVEMCNGGADGIVVFDLDVK